MNEENLFHLCDYCADHIEHFNTWPAEFEDTTTGRVWTFAEYTALLENSAPALWRLLWGATE